MGKILVVDYGSQYAMLIARRLREIGVYSEIASPAQAAERMPDAAGMILSGGPASVFDVKAPKLDPQLLQRKVPVLGICYGMQLLAHELGGEVAPCSGERGYGPAKLTASPNSGGLFGTDSIGRDIDVWLSHGDQVVGLPPGFACIANSPSAPIAAMANGDRHIYGVQFHPEVTHTPSGKEFLRRFAADICSSPCDWSMPAFIDEAAASIRAQAGKEHILLGLSGGVDSAVAAALIERAVPGQLTCVLVDNGLLREGEADEVEAAFRPLLGERLVVARAEDQFLDALAGVAEPEAKRKIIGRTFIEVFEQQARQLGDIKWLGQGTIYPDVIESAGGDTGTAASIKSHHNVGGLPDELDMQLIEPLRRLFKDEVRTLGRELGLADSLIGRHPFPGPGLAVRVLGAVSAERLATVRQADAIYLEELRAAGWYDKVAQAFAVLLPVSTVGVMGDSRTYAEAVALRAVTTDDFMTADWARLPPDLLARIASRIANEVAGVNRVAYDITSKPPATVEWE